MKRLLVLSVAVAALALGPAVYAQNSMTNPTGDQKNGVGGFQPYGGGASSKTNTMTTNNGTGVGGFQPYGGGASAKPGQQTTGDQGATPPKSQ